MPLLAGGLLLVAGLTASATLLARSGAVHELDARAAGYRTLAQANLGRTGRLGSAVAAAHSDGVALALVPTDQPLPGGRAVTAAAGKRTYTYTVTARHDKARRVSVTLPDARVGEVTIRALLISLALGAVLLALLAAAVIGRLRRSVTAPLEGLRAAIDQLTAGRAAKPNDVGGAREVRSVARRLQALATTVAELEAQATTDPLTGVANRRSFHTSLTAEMARATRESHAMTLVLIDLDGFKQINDTHGHPFGDGVLQVIADKVSSTLRATDVLARVGGDEFAIILPRMPRGDATRLVERARDEATRSVGGVQLTWCAGIATFPTDARDGETLMECADAALYCAKNTGASAVCHYDPEQAQLHPSGDRGLVEALLEKPDAVVPVFQPLVSLSTGQVSGYEALARFPHPPARRPDEWFAIAARCGLGPELEARAVKEALASRGRPRGTYLSFNLSASALMSDAAMVVLPSDLSDIVIEITENERVADDEKLAARLAPLKARGARIAVDDAGAGYSGLQQLMRIHPDLIKLDRSLVANVDQDPAKAALIDSFVRFARRTGASVCAEGIETPDELKVLADLDVTYGQGFGLARPAAPWASVAPWVAGTIRPRSLRTDAAAEEDDGQAEAQLAATCASLAGVRVSEELPGLAQSIAGALGADEVCIVRPAPEGNGVECLTDHAWLAAGGTLSFANYPTLRQMLSSREGVQVLVGDPSADLGDLSLLGRGPYGSMLLAPAVALGEAVGLLVAFGREERPWSRAETNRALIVAAQLGPLLTAVPGMAELAQPAA